jgi:quercetin dioxygenase-like cupin family protein
VWGNGRLTNHQPLIIFIHQTKEFDMTISVNSPVNQPQTLRVAAGEDRFGEHRGLGISEIAFKVVPQDSDGLLIIENTFHAKGGPARHLHHNQDEWFYALEGEFILEIGSERYTLHPGDSLLAPRQVPHVWAYVGETLGRMLITFLPAGKMEAFFREVTKANAMPPQDPAVWQAHDMELMGPPLLVA